MDDLLRRGVFVDLYAVVRNGLRISQPRYSIKNLEVFLPLERRAEVKDGGASILMFEEWTRTRNDSLLDAIADYNREDCRSTLLLRDWLLDRQRRGAEPLRAVPRPEAARRPRRRRSGTSSARPCAPSCSRRGSRLAGELLDYHRREEKPVWWAFFDRFERTAAELVEDAESIGGLEWVGVARRTSRARRRGRSRSRRRSTRSTQGEDVIDPATKKGAGEVLESDRDARRLVLQARAEPRRRAAARGARPGRAVRHGRPSKAALARFGRSLLARRRALPGARGRPAPRAVPGAACRRPTSRR